MITAKTEARRKRDECFRAIGEIRYRDWIKAGRPTQLQQPAMSPGEDAVLREADVAVSDVALQ